MKKRLAVLLVVLAVVPLQRVTACTWAEGFFHQVRSLKGRVVGTTSVLRNVRWLRQSVSRPGARLTLYAYTWPLKPRDRWQEVAHTTADKKGYFDFGDLREGHYELVIDTDGGWTDFYDVEITSKAKRTKQITIDVSPVHPDCRGGHEFIVETEG